MSDDQGQSLVGRKIGSYEILARLGAGGMGEVYRAHDTKLGREVAFKVLPAALAHDPERLARFEREARLLAALNHPNIAAIHGLEDADGVRALILELVEGPTLAESVASAPIATDGALPIARQIAAALEAAHEKGILHRDLKPANIKLRPDGTVKVLDFGLAKRVSGQELAAATTRAHASLTEPWVLMGTLAYMAPEQLRGQPADARSDVWALGVVLYEMAAGARPFEGKTGFELSSAILDKPPPALPSSVPPQLCAVITRCLEKEPARRYQRAGDVRAALETIQLRARRPLRGTLLAVSTGVLVILGLAAWEWNRISKRAWVHADAIPQLKQLIADENYQAAAGVAARARKILPHDGALDALWRQIIQPTSVATAPPGAEIHIAEYADTPVTWRELGRAPLESVPVTRGLKRWRVIAAGHDALEWAAYPGKLTFSLVSTGSVPAGMVRIPAGATIPGLPVSVRSKSCSWTNISSTAMR